MDRIDDPWPGGRHLANRTPPRRRRLRLSGWAWLIGLATALVVIAAALIVTRGTGQYGGGSGGASGSGCGGSRTPLEVLAAPEQAALIQQAASDYAQGSPKVNGTCVNVHVQSMEPAAALDKLVRGWPDSSAGSRPAVWVPPSSVWGSLLAFKVQAAGAGAASASSGLLVDPQGSIATSPLVAAMPRPMAQALGWPGKQLGWGDLLGLLRNPAGWAGARHPEWGAVKLGQSDPLQSTPALESLFGAVTFGAMRGQPLTFDSFNQQRQPITQILAGIGGIPGPHVDLSADLLAALRRADAGGKALDYASVMFLSEQQVWAYNHGTPKVPLAAVYPGEGIPQSDYPWLSLKASWVSDNTRTAAADFLRFLREPTAQARFQAAGFRSASGVASAELSQSQGVLPNGASRILAPPGAEVVTALLQGWTEVAAPTNLLLVFDVSGSMKEPVPQTNGTKIDLIKTAIGNAAKLLPSNFNLALWEFATRLGPHPWRQLVPIGPMDTPGPGGVTTRERLAVAAGQLAATNNDTALYDTTLAAYQYMRQHYVTGGTNAIAIVTDGINDNPAGGLTLDQLVQQLRAAQAADAARSPAEAKNPILVNTVGYGANVDAAALQRIAATTSGHYLPSPDPRSIQQVLAQMITTTF